MGSSVTVLRGILCTWISGLVFQAFLAVNEFPFSEMDLCKHHVCEMQSVLWRVGSSPAQPGRVCLRYFWSLLSST